MSQHIKTLWQSPSKTLNYANMNEIWWLQAPILNKQNNADSKITLEKLPIQIPSYLHLYIQLQTLQKMIVMLLPFSLSFFLFNETRLQFQFFSTKFSKAPFRQSGLSPWVSFWRIRGQKTLPLAWVGLRMGRQRPLSAPKQTCVEIKNSCIEFDLSNGGLLHYTTPHGQ